MEPTTTQITPCFPNDIWPEISHHLHAKSLYVLSQVSHFFEPICQPNLKVTKFFFDVFDNLQADYCEKTPFYYKETPVEKRIQERIIYSRINTIDIKNVTLSLKNVPTTRPFISLDDEIPGICRELRYQNVHAYTAWDRLKDVIQKSEFENFEDAVKYIPIEIFREIALGNCQSRSSIAVREAVNLFDQITQCDFAIAPVLGEVIQSWALDEPLRSNCINAGMYDGVNDPVYYCAKIKKINVIFRTEFCKKEILDAVEIVNAKLAKV